MFNAEDLESVYSPRPSRERLGSGGVNVGDRINISTFTVAEVRSLFSSQRDEIQEKWLEEHKDEDDASFRLKYGLSAIRKANVKKYKDLIVHVFPREFEDVLGSPEGRATRPMSPSSSSSSSSSVGRRRATSPKRRRISLEEDMEWIEELDLIYDFLGPRKANTEEKRNAALERLKEASSGVREARVKKRTSRKRNSQKNKKKKKPSGAASRKELVQKLHQNKKEEVSKRWAGVLRSHVK